MSVPLRPGGPDPTTTGAQPASPEKDTLTVIYPEDRHARSRGLAQPWMGLAGLAIVLAAAALLGIVPGLQRSLESIGPWSTYCLPVMAVTILWWGGWPVATQSRGVRGAAILAAIVGLGLVFTGLAQAAVGKFQPSHLLGTTPETLSGHMVGFPWLLPLGTFVFVAMLQLTLVCRQWPLQKVPTPWNGVAALAISWAIGLVGYELLTNWDFLSPGLLGLAGVSNPGGPVSALSLVGSLLCITVWQLTLYLLLGGWPVDLIHPRAWNLVAGNAVTVAGGLATWWVLFSGIGLTANQVSAGAGAAVIGIVVAGLLMENWPARLIHDPGWSKVALLGTAVAVAVIAGVALKAIAQAATWTTDPYQMWVALVGLEYIGALAIVHVAGFGRWPLPVAEPES